MYEAFYKIIYQLMIDYFKKIVNKSGDRFYVIVDNKSNDEINHFNMFLNILNDGNLSKPFVVSEIYPTGQIGVQEVPYKTKVIQMPEPCAPIIIGVKGSNVLVHDNNENNLVNSGATEDYLVTLRNATASGEKYESYSLLYVLSENLDESSKLLSSIDTPFTNLRGYGMPLSVEYIVKEIKNKASAVFERKHEYLYYDVFITEIAKKIEDGGNLYDLIPALGVLQRGSIIDNFNDLDFFPDKIVIDCQNRTSDQEITSRATENSNLYRNISEIMAQDDDANKFDMLTKFLDENLSRKIANCENEEWRQIDLQEILNSVENKNSTDSLAVISVSHREEGIYSNFIYNFVDKNIKKTTTYGIVCHQSGISNLHLDVGFNKRVVQSYVNNDPDVELHGKHILINVPDRFVRVHSIGVQENHHDFYILALQCKQDFFNQVIDKIKISKKGEIVIPVPIGQESVCFGSSADVIEILYGSIIEYSENNSYIVKIDPDADRDYKINFKIKFSSVEIPFVLDVKVDESGKINPVDNPNKRDRYCKWEDEFIRTKVTRLVVDENDLQKTEVIEGFKDPIDDSIYNSLNNIYEYYSKMKAGPTLIPLDSESRALFRKYLDEVIKSLEEIQINTTLPKSKYYLTKLGVVEFNGRVYFSSFNPLMVAYMLEYENEKDSTEVQYGASKILSPFNLLPFMSYGDVQMCPCWDDGLKDYKNWMCFDNIKNSPKSTSFDVVSQTVSDRIQNFISHFNYLFQNKDIPIVISTVGIENDKNVIRGILKYILREYERGVQKIELHEYVSNLMDETFFEKLNRLVSRDQIVKELESLGEKIEKKGEYSSHEIITLLFSKVSLYKHEISDEIDFCHIAFYQKDINYKISSYPTDALRVEFAYNGLVPIPSTSFIDDYYVVGFGTGGANNEYSTLFKTTKLINNLYVNEINNGQISYQTNTCLAKKHKFCDTSLLHSIYENANWVTFINPEVDIDFFYKQEQLYVIHYADQDSINAKYSSITVTRHVNQYHNLIKRTYERHNLDVEKFEDFNQVMAKYFNCLNGNWLLSLVNKTVFQVDEKMSIVAASIAMQRFMQRSKNIIWIPISLEEILRVSNNIQLPKNYIFTKDDLKAIGPMSDDLLMVGLEAGFDNSLSVYLYPIEVKFSKTNSFSDKGIKQVSHTFEQIRDHLLGDDNFTQRIFKTFFMSQYLINAEKLHANNLISTEKYQNIQKHRYNLLNLKYKLEPELPIKEMGHAALVSFYSDAKHSIVTSKVEGDVNVCEIHFSAKECFEIVANPDSELADFLENGKIEFYENLKKSNDNCVNDNFGKSQGESSCFDHKNETIFDNSSVKNKTDAIITNETNDVEETDVTNLEKLNSGMKIVLGFTQTTGTKIVFEPNNTRIVSHPNMGIIGTMGTGKTQFSRSVIAQLSKNSNKNIGEKSLGILIFDYKGDYKDEDFLKITGGESYKFNYPFNPLKLIQTPDLEGVNLPAVTADRISDSFAKAYGLGQKQQGNIKQIIIETYAEFGITRDPSTWSNLVPTMNDVLRKYFDKYDANDKVYVLFDKLRDYTIFTSTNDTCVSIFEWLDKVRVIDLTIYPDDTKKVIVSLILDLFYAEMRQLGESKQLDGFRQLRSFIMVDEAHQFLKKDFNSLRSIISEGRMFGVGMILSTQNLSDFRTSSEDYSKYILSWVIHHVNSVTKSEMANIFGATDSNIERYMEKINNARNFESICKIGNIVRSMRDLPFYELIRE